MTPEVALTGLGVPEGPVVHPDTSLTFTEQTRGRVSRCQAGVLSVVAVTGGAPNSHAAGSDGRLYVAQNGGVVGAWRSPDPRAPGIQAIEPDGSVHTVLTATGRLPLQAPNDLVFGPDGALWFTDPAQPFDPADRRPQGRIVRWSGGPAELVLDVGPVFCNGLAFQVDGSLVWVESYDRHVCRLGSDGSRTVVAQLPEGHVPDGLAVAVDGRMFIATCGSHAVTVLGPDGAVEDVLLLDDRAVPTNCAFGPDGVLWVTDFGVDWETDPAAGRLWRVPTDAVGLAVGTGAVPDRERAP
jgi:gluconolactonase